ncbi:MAG: PQQ-binding-like beta-propeller repeat protein [Candidatus Bathyarchaeota archaeon]|nr:PQQ-binding-like beta-propeller repeat protein [Candidatus Termiticorpusculum sp.]
MNVIKNKKLISMLAILLILSFATSMLAIPNANAQSDVFTWPFVDAVPKIAGVGQPVLINWGLINYLGDTNDGWNVTLQIFYPNGKVENISGKTWSTGTVGRKMAFAEPGDYILRCAFEGERYNNRNYAASLSKNMTLQIVEGYWKPDHPGHSIPTEYWTRPVDSQLREWYTMMGSWLITRDSRGAPLYAPYNFAPESAHILWSMPIGDNFGGLAGGDSGPIGYETGEAYDGKFANSLIISGVLYFNRYVSNSPKQTVVAVDLHTGKIIWEKDFNFGNAAANRPSSGQILTFISENNRGTWSYLWFTSGTNMYAVNPATGDLVYNMTSVPGGTIYYGPSGELLKYRMVNYGTAASPRWYLQRWNATYVVNDGTRNGTADAWGTNVRGRTYNADILGWDLNVSVAGLTFIPGQVNVAVASATGSLAGASQQAAPITVQPEVRAVFGNTSANGVTLTGISLDPENNGYTMYNSRTWQAPKEWADLQSRGWAAHSHDDGVSVIWTKDNTKNYAFSLETGRFLWESESQYATDAWASRTGCIAYGNFYTASTSGILYCYDVKTGELLWTYEATDKYNESYHGENWWLIIQFISDGKVYVGHEVHSPTLPISRGAPYLALNATNGELIWRIDGAFRQNHWGGRSIIGDSVIATMDVYDQQVYAIGKGPSEMTVTSSNAVTNAGTTILVSGTVMDVSPGTESDSLKMRFPKGVPAVGDDSMNDWMLYAYKNFAQPMNVKGIEVTVYAWDVNNNEMVEIGTTESDSRGRFSIRWTPEKEGDYDIWAYFEGTKSYYGSDAKAEIAVLDAPVTPEPEKNPPYEWYIIGMGIAIIAAIAINIFVTLRKK